MTSGSRRKALIFLRISSQVSHTLTVPSRSAGKGSDAAEVQFLGFVALFHFFLGGLAAGFAPVVEEAEGGVVDLVGVAGDGTFELHEAAVGIVVHADGALEFGDLHLAAGDEGVDFVADDIAVVGDGSVLVIVIVFVVVAIMASLQSGREGIFSRVYRGKGSFQEIFIFRVKSA